MIDDPERMHNLIVDIWPRQYAQSHSRNSGTRHAKAACAQSHKSDAKGCGGNTTKIRVKEGSRVINLHQFWDGAVLGSSDPQAARNAAAKLRSAYPKASLTVVQDRPYIDASSFERWGR